jgi:tRNA pseudouridine55 synthase
LKTRARCKKSPHFPSEQVDDVTVAQIRNGREFRTSPFGTSGTARHVKAIDSEGALIAIGEATMPHMYHPVLVL